MDYTRITPDSSEIYSATLSADGQVVAYIRNPAHTRDEPPSFELYVHDRRTGQTTQITRSEDDEVLWGDGTLGDVALSADGSKVLFISRVSTLTNDDNDEGHNPYDRDLYIHDRNTGMTQRVKVMDPQTPGEVRPLDHISEVAASADGTKVSFIATDGGWTRTAVYLYDTATRALTKVSLDEDDRPNTSSHYNDVQISADGTEVYYRTVGDGPLIVYDVGSGEREILPVNIVSAGEEASLTGAKYDVSGDGRFVVYEATNDDYETWIEVYDRQTGQRERIDVSSTEAAANDHSYSPTISDDGRFVVFASEASNLAPGQALNRTDLFIRDRQTGETKLLTRDLSGTPNNPGSYAAEISADGRTIMLETTVEWDIGDDNESPDIYVTTNPFFEAEAPNEAPRPMDDSATAVEDTPVVIDLLANDTDPEGGPLKVFSVDGTGPHAGTVKINADGTVTYLAADSLRAGQTVQDVLRYAVVDAGGKTAAATLTVTATGVNDAPETADDVIVVDEGASTADILAELLANDVDPEGDALEVVSVEGPYFGRTLFDRAAQTLRFHADTEDFTGAFPEGLMFNQTLTYTVRDASGAERTQESMIVVRGVNDAPVAAGDALTVAENGASANLWETLLLNDQDIDLEDGLTIVGVDVTGTKGEVTFDAAGRTLSYHPAAFDPLRPGGTGQDSFSYIVRDEHGAESRATVQVTITGDNDAPTANPDPVTVQEGAVSGNLIPTLLQNDFDADAAPGELKVVAVTQPGKGVLTLDAEAQTLTFSAEGPAFDSLGAGQSAPTQLVSYTVRDAHGAESTATLVLNVTGVNDAPVARAEGLGVDETMQADITDVLLANDTDVDAGDTRSIVAVDLSGAPGIRFDAATGRVRYDGSVHDSLRAGEHVVGTFTYTVRDSGGLESTATVMVRTDGVNDAPEAKPDAVSVAEDATTANLWTTLLANDTDPDAGDTRTIVGVDATGTKGRVVFDAAAQSLRYEASGQDDLQPGQTGTDTFRYTIRDAFGALSTATVTMNVAGAREDDGWIYGTAGTDLMEGTDAAERFRALEQDDQVFGRGGDDVIEGGAGNDRIDGGSGRDALFGGAGQDVVAGGLGDLELDGGADADLAMLDFSVATRDVVFSVDKNLTGTETVLDTLVRGFERVEIQAGSGFDTLSGGAGADVLRGGGMNDLLRGGAGDKLYGETGDDYVIVEGVAAVMSGGEGEDDWANIGLSDRTEALRFSIADNLAGTVNLAGMEVSGFERLWIGGGSGADRFIGGDRRDRLIGRDGDDILRGGGEEDHIEGGRGADWVDGGAGRDRIFAGDGDDTIDGGAGDYEIDGGAGNDLGRLDFTASTADLAFTVAANLAAGGTAVGGTAVRGIEQVLFNAGSGGDRISGGASFDQLRGGDGADVLRGEGADDQLHGEGGDDVLIGGGGIDQLVGGEGDDELWADTPDADLALGARLAGVLPMLDVLDGGAGADTLHLGAGSTATGGGGADRFVLDASDLGVVITDMQAGAGGDRIDVSALLDGTADPFRTGRLRLEARDGGSVLLFDADGSGPGAAVAVATLQGVAPAQLTAANFAAFGPDGAPVVVNPVPPTQPVNLIRGTNKSESVNGTEGRDEILGLQGQDLIRGRGGDDRIDGGEGLDALFGEGGNDWLLGGQGADALDGGDGDDRLDGGEGTDVLHGGAGRDVLAGGSGTDLLWGGEGADRFVFERGGGADVIGDFTPGRGAGDVLDLSAFAKVDGMEDLRITSFLGQAVVSWEGGSVTLVGVKAGDLVADDFLFAGQTAPVQLDALLV